MVLVVELVVLKWSDLFVVMFAEYGKKWLDSVSAARLRVVANFSQSALWHCGVFETFEKWELNLVSVSSLCKEKWKKTQDCKLLNAYLALCIFYICHMWIKWLV